MVMTRLFRLSCRLLLSVCICSAYMASFCPNQARYIYPRVPDTANMHRGNGQSIPAVMYPHLFLSSPEHHAKPKEEEELYPEEKLRSSRPLSNQKKRKDKKARKRPELGPNATHHTMNIPEVGSGQPLSESSMHTRQRNRQ